MANKYLDGTGVAQVWNAATNSFVAKEDGKGLSTNDLTDEMVEKVNGAANAEEVTTELGKKADASSVYTKEETYTQEETNQAIQTAVKSAVTGIYRVKGSIAFADLPTKGQTDGDVYNVTDAFTTTDAFVEGTGVEYPAGTNVVWVEASGKWDCMAGTYDFSDFPMKDDIGSLTEDEIAAICTMPTV